MSEWVARLGIVFPDKAKAEFDQFVEEVKNEHIEYLSLTKDYDESRETKPTYEQISQERILDEANKNVQVLKSLETILQERTQSYNTFFAAQGKYKPSFEIFQYCEGTLRQALDALFVFLEQELQQARQQQTLGDLRKALSEVKVDAQRRLSDYQREVSNAEKDVLVAEKKLSKSKELLEKALEQKHKLEAGDHDSLGLTPRRALAITRYHTQRGDINKQEKIKECLESISKSDKEIREGVQNLLRALGARDQVVVASRRAYQKLDKDCKKAVALTFRKLIVREREAAAARESVLAKLEGAVDKIDVDADLEDFILEHRQGVEGSVQCCVQALTVLGDLRPQDSHPAHGPSRGLYSYRSPSVERGEMATPTPSATLVSGGDNSIPSTDDDPANSRLNWDGRAERRPSAGPFSPSPTPIALAATASATLSYAVTTGLPIAEAFASIVSLCTGEKKKIVEKDDVSSEKIGEHLTRIFYYNSVVPSAEDQRVRGAEGRASGLTFDLKQSPPIIAEDGGRRAANCSPEAISISERQTHILRHPLAVELDGPSDPMPADCTAGSDDEVGPDLKESPRADGTEGKASTGCVVSGREGDGVRAGGGGRALDPMLCVSTSTGLGLGLGSSSTRDIEGSAKWLSEAVRTQRGRDAFIVELNQFRSKKVDIGGGFDILGNVLWNVLDRCKEDNDVHSAKVIMMLSQTFYRRRCQLDSDTVIITRCSTEYSTDVSPLHRPSDRFPSPNSLEPFPTALSHWRGEDAQREREAERRREVLRARAGEVAGLSDDTEDTEDNSLSDDGDNYRLADRGAGSREYLKGSLMSHAIWRDKSFWEQALWQCTMEQLRTIPYEHAWHDIPEEGRLEAVTTVHNVIFSQVMAITHSMVELGCSKRETREFLQRMCMLHGLAERQRQDLLRHLMSR